MTPWIRQAEMGFRSGSKVGWKSFIGLAVIAGTAYLIYKQFHKPVQPVIPPQDCAANMALDVPNDVTLVVKPNDIESTTNVPTDDLIEDVISIVPILL